MSKPFLDRKATDQLNLTVLRRVDPDTEQVLATAGHVALYDFDKGKKAWTRKDVEGSLFLLKRQTQPRFKIIILNKKSQDNFVEDVLGGFHFEVATPYVLYRNKLDEVVGIWFYDEAECAMVAGLLQRITAAFSGQATSEPLPSQVSALEAQLQLPEQTTMQASEPQPSTAHGDGDTFWDRPNHANNAAAAESRAKLLQPNMQHTSQPVPSSSAQSSAHGKGSLETPFADAAEQPLADGLSSNAEPEPVQANVLSMFQKLAGGQQDATAQQNGSPPRMLMSPGGVNSSPTMQVPGPIGDAQQQNPLSALFASMKVSSSTPTALTPPPHLRPPSSNQPPHQASALAPSPHLKTPSGSLPAPQQQNQASALTPTHLRNPASSGSGPQQLSAATPPALLTPSFLRQRSTSAEVLTPSAQQRQEGDPLRQVLARVASKGIPQSEQQSGSLQSQTAASHSAPHDTGSSARDRVRQAMIELANSDSFIDVIVQQLQAKDLLRQ